MRRPDMSLPAFFTSRTALLRTRLIAGFLCLALGFVSLTAGAQGSVVYYGMHGSSVAPAQAGQSNTIAITGITDGTTYTVRDLDTTTNIASGTVNRGSQSLVANLVNNHHFKVSASRPVQAQIYYEFDNAANYYGNVFFMSDNGVTEIGRSFVVPVPLLTNSPIQYWIFANGAGTVTVKTLAGATAASNTFAAAGAWQIPAAAITGNTVYTVTSANVDFAVQQSSQNVSTEVPPSSQAATAGSCSIPGTGTSFMIHSQPYGGNNIRIAAFAYTAGTTYTVNRLNGCNGGGSVFTNRALTVGTLDYRSLGTVACPFQITSNNPIGIQVGSTEGATTNVYDMGDDSGYLRGNGNEIRGHALRCGGAIFVGQDGTNVSGTGITTTPALPLAGQNADTFINITGNFANNNMFDVTTQDASHPAVIQIFGGNCDTQLNDWQKTMRPAALAAPTITSPSSGVNTNAINPVTGAGVPGATVTVSVYNGGGVAVATGTATVNAAGNWTVTVSPNPPDGNYTIKAVQGLAGVCAVNPNPPGGVIVTYDTVAPVAPVIVAPANGSSTTSLTPTLSGTAEANSTVTLTLTGPGGPFTIVTSANAAGNFSVPSPALTQGAYSVTATAKDLAGNISVASAAKNFNIVFAAPALASPIVYGATSISGTSTAANGTAITVYKNGVAIVCTPAATVSGGTWSCGGVSGLAAGNSITATAGTGATQSAASAAVIVGTAPLTITANNASRTYGAANPSFTVSYNAFVNGDTALSLGGTLSCTTTAIATTVPGTYPITCSGQTSTNYAFSYVAGTLTITQATLTVTANNFSRAFGSANPAFTVSYGGFVNSETSAVLGGSLLCTTAATPASPVGTYAITCSGQTSGNYAISYVAGVLTVVNAAPSVISPLPAGAGVISGTSSAADGTLITVYKNGTPISCSPAATVSGGVWSCGGVSGLIGGESITATAGTGAAASAISAAVIVTPAAPAVSGPIVTGVGVTVTGTSTAPNGSSVTVLVNGTPVVCTPAATVSGGVWSCGGITLNPGDVVTSTVTANGQTSAGSSAQTVHFSTPAVNGPIVAGAGSLSGTSGAADGTVITVYNNGTPISCTPASTVSGGVWTCGGASGLAGGESITATAGPAGAAQSAISSAVIVTPAAPAVSGPIVTGLGVTVSGTSTAPNGSSVTVLVNGTPVVCTPAATVSGGVWSCGGITLNPGDVITSTVTANGQTSAGSSAQTVHYSTPAVNGPIVAGAGSLSGTSSAADGTVITVYNNGTPVVCTPAATVSGGVWTCGGASGLLGGESITATAGPAGAAQSATSSAVIVTPAAPAVSGPIVTGSGLTASGTSSAPNGTPVTVLVNGTPVVCTPAATVSGGVWSCGGLNLNPGDVLTTTVTTNGQTSAASIPLTVLQLSPAVNGPIYPTDTTITGASLAAPGTAITVYRNGALIGTTTVLAGGTWTLSGVSGLNGSDLITATAGAGASQSLVSAPQVVAALPGLLRNGALGMLSPTAGQKSAIFPRTLAGTGDPALARADLVMALYNPAASYPQEFTDYTDTATPIVFFQLEANSGNSLRITKDKLNGKLVINY